MSSAADRAVAAKGEQTRQTILDAAETLFGFHHYDSVSLRSVAAQAKVGLGVVSHHFRKKEILFEAVVTRKADQSNQIRLQRLGRDDDPSVEQILDAFVGPTLEQAVDPSWRAYNSLVGQVSRQERWAALDARMFRTTAQAFHKALERALPSAPAPALAAGLTYLVYALIGATEDIARATKPAGSPRVALLDTGAPTTADIDEVRASLVAFASAGMRALAGAR